MTVSGGLSGRGALVTGGGRGIGAAVASALAADGAAVVVASRTAGEVERVATSLEAGGGRARAVVCDVTDPSAVLRMVAEANEFLETLDILVNNAGVAPSAPLHRIELAEWNRTLAVNATGPFLCTKAVVPGMVERGWGRVVNVASVAGLAGARYVAAYTASKHALVGLTRAVAAEVAGRGVTVNAVCPGYVDTPMTARSVDRIMEKTGRSREEAMAFLEGQSPQGRLIEPDEVAHAVRFLCGAGARGIHGQAIVIDGGALLA